jgi:ribosomal-protein-serine acetyltransferase
MPVGENDSGHGASMFDHRIDDDTSLCLLEPRHVEELNALIERNRDHIKKWSAWMKDDHSIEHTRSFIKRNLRRFANSEGFALAIWYQGEMAGQIEYNYIDLMNRKTEIGFWLGASFQGKGLATKSCRVLIDHAFAGLRLNRVEMQCGVENKGSRRICEKLGFREEGVIRQAAWLHDHFVDFVYGMLACEWQSDPQR